MAYYAGLDVGLKETFVCVVNHHGDVIREFSVESDVKEIAKALKKPRIKYEIVGLETGQISIWLTKGLREKKLPAVCIDARQVAVALSTVVNKTDKNDAYGIAHLLRCGLYRDVLVKSEEACGLKILLGTRRHLIQQRSKIEARMRGMLKIYGIKIKKTRRKGWDTEIIKAVKKHPATMRDAIHTLLDNWRITVENLEALDKQVAEEAASNPKAALLMTIPGVGPICSLTYLATIDDPHRFASSRSVGAYIGITPRQYASGETQRQGKISHFGPVECRNALYESAHCMFHFCKADLHLRNWAHEKAKKKGTKKTVVALSRRLAVIMHRMLVTGEAFNNEMNAPAEKQKQAERTEFTEENDTPPLRLVASR